MLFATTMLATRCGCATAYSRAVAAACGHADDVKRATPRWSVSCSSSGRASAEASGTRRTHLADTVVRDETEPAPVIGLYLLLEQRAVAAARVQKHNRGAVAAGIEVEHAADGQVGIRLGHGGGIGVEPGDGEHDYGAAKNVAHESRLLRPSEAASLMR